MCAQFGVFKDGKFLARIFKAKPPVRDIRRGMVLPRRLGPVVTFESGGRALSEKQFGLIPSWSKEGKVKFSTHNARLVSTDEKTGKQVPIYTKPTWREPFSRRHCLVPMEHFVEAIYSGEFAGNMVKFIPTGEEIIAAAGLWEDWVSKSSGEVVSTFAVITDEPVPYIKSIGHDRSPVFLAPKDYDEWLGAGEKGPQGTLEFLQRSKADFSWKAEIDRPMAAGWEKRV
jgi:putative SOS response-associated peptidase YedK